MHKIQTKILLKLLYCLQYLYTCILRALRSYVYDDQEWNDIQVIALILARCLLVLQSQLMLLPQLERHRLPRRRRN
jgi:hypothetical protein